MIVEYIGLLLFFIAFSSDAGFKFVQILIQSVRWFDMNILGMDYQTFWLIFIILVAVLSVAGLLILWSISRALWILSAILSGFLDSIVKQIEIDEEQIQ